MVKSIKNMEGKIVFKGKSKSGMDMIIRYPRSSDLGSLLNFINEISKERSFILYQGEKVTLEEERKYLENLLEKIASRKTVKLLVLTNEGDLIGSADITMKNLAMRHLGDFGIALAKKYRGDGIGKILIEEILKEAKKELPEIRTILLGVFETNNVAANLYSKFGFKQYGRLPKGIMRENSFEDEILMYKNI